MLLRITCDSCGGRFTAPSFSHGRSASCPTCQQPLTMPFGMNHWDDLDTSVLEPAAAGELPKPVAAPPVVSVVASPIAPPPIAQVLPPPIQTRHTEDLATIRLQEAARRPEASYVPWKTLVAAGVVVAIALIVVPDNSSNAIPVAAVPADMDVPKTQPTPAPKVQAAAPGANTAAMRFAKVEQFYKKSRAWSVLDVTGSGGRFYSHPAGVGVEFWRDKDGTERMQVEISDKGPLAEKVKLRKQVYTFVWATIISIGGEAEETIEENARRIESFGKNPTEVLNLVGGLLHFHTDDDGTTTLDVFGTE